MNTKRFLEAAIEAAHLAGNYIEKKRENVNHIQFKGAIDLVTEVDLNSEKMILNHLQQHFPDHAFLTEEAGKIESDSPFRWIIDPIDGTTNFAHGFPVYCVSIALYHKDEPIVGVVNDCSRQELYYAQKGEGAFRNNTRIQVSQTDDLRKALLASGFPYDVQTNPDNNLKEFGNFLMTAQSVRRPGSAAIDLCQVACGHFDGFWEPRLHPWDMAAGVLIVTEAGGQVSNYAGGPFDLFGDEILVSNGRIHQQMIDVLAETRT